MIFTPYEHLAHITNRAGEADALMVSTESHDARSVEAVSNLVEQHLETAGREVSALSAAWKPSEADAEAHLRLRSLPCCS